jgi:hypothetical protein
VTLNPLLKLSLRGILAWCLLAAAGFLFARAILAPFLPLMEMVIDGMQSDFMAHLSITDARDKLTIAMSCTANRELMLSHDSIIPFLGSFNCASTDVVHALVPMIIFSVAVIGWPISHRHEILRRLLGFLVLLPVVVALTTPVLLVGLVESRVHPESFSADAQWTALIQPWVFMEMGGGWLLPLVAALLCVRFSQSAQSSAAKPQ